MSGICNGEQGSIDCLNRHSSTMNLVEISLWAPEMDIHDPRVYRQHSFRSSGLPSSYLSQAGSSDV